MDLYVANCTRQVHHFQYRMPESNKLLEQHIPIGGQIRVASGDLNSPAIDGIIAQHAPYGLVRVDDIIRGKSFHGLCYSIGKPIRADRIRGLMDQNNGVLVERGKELRKEAAVAANDILERSLADSGLPEQLRKTEVEVIEENPEKRPDDGIAPVAEGIRVEREPNTARRRAKK